MNKISLILGFTLLASCTNKESKPAPVVPVAPDNNPGILGPVGRMGSNGDKGDKGDSGASIGTRLEKLAQVKECSDRSGIKITVWTESQTRDGVMQKEEEASAQSSFLCDGIQGVAGAEGKAGELGAAGNNGDDGKDGKNLAVITETIYTWDSACSDKGGYKLKIWLDDDADRIIDSTEEKSLSTHVICNGEKGRQGPQGPSGSSGSSGTNGQNAYNYTIKNINLTSKDQSVIHNGRQTLICAADVMSGQPDFRPQGRLIGKLYSNGKLIQAVSGARLENDRYVMSFPVNAGWTAIGSAITCEMTLRSSFQESGIAAKETSSITTVVENPNLVPASMLDVLQTRAENFSGKLSFVFTLAADAPVTSSNCELTLTKTLENTAEMASFNLKKGETRVTLSAAVAKAFDVRLDLFSVQCEDDEFFEKRLLWADGLFEINPADTSKFSHPSYQLQLALLAVPFLFKDIGSYLPPVVADRLTKQYLPKISTMSPEQRAGFILFLAKTKQLEALKSLSSLRTWYVEAYWAYPCNSDLTDIPVLQALFGEDTYNMLVGSNGCSDIDLKKSAASFATNMEDREFNNRDAIPDYLGFLKYFKIQNFKNLVKLLKHVIANDATWTKEYHVNQLLAVLQMQPDLFTPANTALLTEVMPSFDDQPWVTADLFATWPELRIRYEDRLLSNLIKTMDRTAYQFWLSRKASTGDLQSALDKLGKTAGFIYGLGALLPREKDKVCPLIADAIKANAISDYSIIETAMADCQTILIPTLAEGFGAKALTTTSMPKYVEALLKAKGESAPELTAILSSSNSAIERLELVRQGRATADQVLNSLHYHRIEISDLVWLQDRPLFKATWITIEQEAETQLKEILNTINSNSWQNAERVSLYLQIIPQDRQASLQPLLLKACIKGWLVDAAKAWLLQPSQVLTQESIDLLAESLNDYTLALNLKASLVPFYKKAGLNLDVLVANVVEAASAENRDSLDLFKGFGTIGEIQSAAVAMFKNRKVSDWGLQAYFRQEGCSSEAAEDLRDLMPTLPIARQMLVVCLIQKEVITEDEQAFVGSNLGDVMKRITIDGLPRNLYLVPYLGEYLRLSDSSYALTSLVQLAPMSADVKGILVELQTIYRFHYFKNSVDKALAEIPL